MSEIRELSQRYAEIAADLIGSEPLLGYIRDSQVTICYLVSDKEKKSNGKLVFGECEKVPEKWKWSVPCDFTITIFEPNVERFTEEQEKILMLHELLHVGIAQDGNEEIYSIIPHDVEEFSEVIKRFGLDWSE